MTALWDTSVLSRMRFDSRRLRQVIDQRLAGSPVRTAAPAILEVSFGYGLMALTDPEHARHLALLDGLVTSGVLRVIPMDGRAGIVAGQLRAALPYAPARRRGDQRSKPMRQAAWLLDIQIAATAFAAGLDVATENRADFDLLAAELTRLYPSAPPLEVVAPPR